MTAEQAVVAGPDALTRTRQRAGYNEAEQQFSLLLQQRLHEVLEGKSNALELLRRYCNETDRLGVMATPASLPREQLRLPVVEAMLWEAVNFVRSDAVGGPVSQHQDPDGCVVEYQVFSTKFPHIVIERTDRYVDGSADPADTTWCLRRVQNQRASTQVNRLLDAANLAFELLRVIR